MAPKFKVLSNRKPEEEGTYKLQEASRKLQAGQYLKLATGNLQLAPSRKPEEEGTYKLQAASRKLHAGQYSQLTSLDCKNGIDNPLAFVGWLLFA